MLAFRLNYSASHAASEHAIQVCSVLQTQGCRPHMQETTLVALRVLLTSCLDHAFDIALVPGLEEGAWAKSAAFLKLDGMQSSSGLLQVRGHHVKQSCWLEFLRYFNLVRRPLVCNLPSRTSSVEHFLCGRWQHCKILTPAQQQSEDGHPASTL